MMYIAYRNNKTGETQIKDICKDQSDFNTKVNGYRAIYPKKEYDFWITSVFFKQWINKLYIKPIATNTTQSESFFEQTTFGSTHMSY